MLVVGEGQGQHLLGLHLVWTQKPISMPVPPQIPAGFQAMAKAHKCGWMNKMKQQVDPICAHTQHLFEDLP